MKLLPQTKGRLRAPFPYAGGKGGWTGEVNARLGIDDVQTYAEPCAGSLAVLLSRPPAKREIVTDTSSLLSNAWRAMAADPGGMAKWCDWPTLHDDLIARRKWLGRWVAENAARVQDDADWFDAQAGGWWVWCMSHAIRGNADFGYTPKADTRRPLIHDNKATGVGVQAHRHTDKRRPGGGPAKTAVPNMQSVNGVSAQRAAEAVPRQADLIGGQGVSAQRRTDNRRPNIKDNSPSGGMGVQAHRRSDNRRPMLSGERSRGASGVNARRDGDPGGLPSIIRWGPWFDALARRLKQVVVLNRPWTSAVTPAALAARAGGVVAILLDPPYVTAGRSKIYEQDGDAAAVNQVSDAAYGWSLGHGLKYRIAFCHTAGSYDFPAGWIIRTKKYTGDQSKRRTEDAIAFSPRCLKP